MSIEALAMAGADYMECGINFEEWESNDGLKDPPPYLLADEQSFDVDQFLRTKSGADDMLAFDSDYTKRKLLEWAKSVFQCLTLFLKTVQDEGLYAVLQIGPYICAEWNYGGLPVWLHNLAGCEIRTTNDVYMSKMKNFTILTVDMMKKEKLFASQGDPIVIALIENEYVNVQSYYGDAGKAYMNWCSNFAQSLDIGVPWIMCQ
ncbi:unnamed protein product [Prunus armeniaca]